MHLKYEFALCMQSNIRRELFVSFIIYFNFRQTKKINKKLHKIQLDNEAMNCLISTARYVLGFYLAFYVFMHFAVLFTPSITNFGVFMNCG